MSRFLIPLFLIIVSGVLLFGYVTNLFSDIKTLQAQKTEINDTLGKGAELGRVISEKLDIYKKFSGEEKDRLNKFLPDNIDSVRLIIDINEIASRRGLNIRNISVGASGVGPSGSIGPDNREYGTANLSFSISAPYEVFKLFLGDIEDSLRLVDIDSVSFTAGESNLYEYNINIKTYWLK